MRNSWGNLAGRIYLVLESSLGTFCWIVVIRNFETCGLNFRNFAHWINYLKILVCFIVIFVTKIVEIYVIMKIMSLSFMINNFNKANHMLFDGCVKLLLGYDIEKLI